MLKLKSIKKEKADCLAAFRGVEIGAWVEYCHHDVPLEKLTQPASVRIKFILQKKAVDEQAKRLRYFRPHKEPIPQEIEKAGAAREKACAVIDAAREKARAAWEKAYAAVDAAREKACAAREKADANYNKVLTVYLPALAKEHSRLYPDSPWDKISLF